MLTKLKEMREKKNQILADLQKRSDESNSLEEVRALGQQMEAVKEEIVDIDRMIAEADDKRSFNPIATYGAAQKREKKDNDMEYREAFMNHVLRGTPIPAELRTDESTLTSDVSAVIPSVIVNRIVEGLTVCGMILPEVTRTSYAAGVVIPTSSVKPVASWVNEGASSDRQKKTTGSVTFSYNKLRCEISMSMEVGVMAISAFETAFVQNVVDAMTVAIEKAILAGNGSGKPTGILNGTLTSYEVTSEETTGVTYGDLVAMEAKLPIEYDGTAKYFMTKAQFLAFVGMVDDNGQPIARVDWGFENRPRRMLMGREVIIHPYATEMGSYLAGLYDFKDYVLNTIYDMGITKKQDWDTEDLLTKAVMSVDGKPVRRDSLVVLKQKS